MSYTINEITGIIDGLEDSFDPIYTLTKSGGTTNTAIIAVETSILGFDTYDKEYPLLSGIHNMKLKMDSEKPSSLYRDICSAINSAVGGLDTWLTTNDTRVSVLENLMFTTCGIRLSVSNTFPNANLTLFTMNGTTLSAPANLTLVESTDGNLLDATTYFVKVTAINDAGETIGSDEQSKLTTAADASINASWDAVSGATGYKVYIYTTTNEEKYLATVTGSTSYNIKDNGSGSTVPIVNSAHTVADGIAIDTESTGAAKVQYTISSQGSNELRMTVYYKDEDGTAQTEAITIPENQENPIDMVNEVTDITKIVINPSYPGTATDSGAFKTKADR